MLTGQTAIMGASVSADMSLQNVAPVKDWQLSRRTERSRNVERPRSEFCPVRLRLQLFREPPQRHRPTFSRPPRRRPQTRSFLRTRSTEPQKASGISTAPAIRISKVLLPTSASIMATRLTSRSIRIHLTIGSTSIASATMEAWAPERSPPSSTRAYKTSLRRSAMRQPAWSMPATGPFPHPGTFRRMPCLGFISQSSCVRTDFRRKSDPVYRKGRQQPQRRRFPDLGRDMAGLQWVGRSKFLWRRRSCDGSRCRTRLRGKLQPSDCHPRRRWYLCGPAGLFVRR